MRSNIRNSVSSLCNLSSTVARALFLLAADDVRAKDKNAAEVLKSIQANCTLLEELLRCLTVNWACPLGMLFLTCGFVWSG